MAKLLHRIGAKHVKFDLEVEIHYLKLDLPNPSQIKIRVKRSKDKIEETQIMQYSPKLKRVQFDYPLTFRITMYRKNKKYSKKDLSIQVLEYIGKGDSIIGSTRIEFHKIAETGRNIISEELALQECKDPKARLCVTVKLFEEGKARNEFFTGVPTSPNNFNNRRAMSFEGEINLDFDRSIIQASIPKSKKKESEADNILYRAHGKKDSQSLLEPSIDDEEFPITGQRKASVRSIRSAFCISTDLLEELDDKNMHKENIVGVEPEIDSPKQIVVIEDHLGSGSKARKYSDLSDSKDEDKPAITTYSNEFSIEVDNTKANYINKVSSPKEIGSPVKQNEERFNSINDEKIEIHEKVEVICEPEERDTKETHEIPVEINNEYLQYANHNIGEEAFDKDFEDSSSSEEIPVEVEVIDELQVPTVNLKESQPNASSEGARLELKEREAGLPESRDATCCASCIIY